MAIRKDVNDMLNNLKQEEPPKEEKKSKSKFDNMSVDDLLTALNDGKETKPSRKAPIRELKRIPQSRPREQSESGNNDNKKKGNQENNSENKPKRKKIVISGELPDYEAIRQQEIEKDTKEKTSRPAESKEKNENKKNNNNSKKGLFSRVRELMYVSADDDNETEEETTGNTETPDDDDKNSFTIEEIKENTDSTIASIEEAISAITDEKPVKEENKAVTEKENKPEPVSRNKKKNNKSRQNSADKKKTENKTKPENKAEKPESTEEKKSETKTEKSESTEEKKSETKTEKTESTEEKKSEAKTEKTESTEEKKSETKTEKPESPENNKNTNKKNQHSKKKKKSGNKPAQNNSETVKSSESIIENIQKDAESAISEIENNTKSENKKEENTDISVEEQQQVNDDLKQSPESEKENSDSEQVTDEAPREIIITQHGSTYKSSPVRFKSKKYAVLAVICAVLAVIGLIAVISTLISQIKSKKEIFTEAVYPAVITNIDPFESPSELTSDQILNAAIWSAIIDDEKLSKYNEIMGSVIIPAVDVEKFAVELFGEDIPELNHTTVGPAESKFYYNQEAKSYNVPVKPDTFTYLPEVTSVAKKSGEYIVYVNYIEEHPEWMEKAVSKTAEFRLSKNDNGGYKINSMTVTAESSST